MGEESNSLRVQFIAGGLGQGGAEKQFLYMLRALQNVGAEIQVLALTQGEFHEKSLEQLGIRPIRIEKASFPTRTRRIVQAARTFHPHFLQATHFFAGAYAGLAGKITGIPSIGAIRSDLHHDLANTGRASRLILRLPTALLANSHNARENALQMGIPADRIIVLSNVIDLLDFDRRLAAAPPHLLPSGPIRVITVARLMPVKRLERLLAALALARQQAPELEGVLVGDGPERDRLRQTAVSLGMHPDQPGGGVRFLGERSDIPQLLAQSHIFALTSQREGFPNVLLEAMAASLPILSTPAGEARTLVKDGENGFLVPMDAPETLAERLVTLAQSPTLRKKLGHTGRSIVETQYGTAGLAESLLTTYRAVANLSRNVNTMNALHAIAPVPDLPTRPARPG